MRQLKYHEQRLLRKTNFLEWRNTDTKNEHHYISRYYITRREDYYTYRKLARIIRTLAESIASMPDAQKEKYTTILVNRLYSHGLIANRKLVECAKIKIENFCERRLPVLLKRNRMIENLRDAVKFVEQGHVKVGNTRVNNCSVLVSRGMDNFIEWMDGSKLRRRIREFNDEVDDYEVS